MSLHAVGQDGQGLTGGRGSSVQRDVPARRLGGIVAHGDGHGILKTDASHVEGQGDPLLRQLQGQGLVALVSQGGNILVGHDQGTHPRLGGGTIQKPRRLVGGVVVVEVQAVRALVEVGCGKALEMIPAHGVEGGRLMHQPADDVGIIAHGQGDVIAYGLTPAGDIHAAVADLLAGGDEQIHQSLSDPGRHVKAVDQVMLHRLTQAHRQLDIVAEFLLSAGDEALHAADEVGHEILVARLGVQVVEAVDVAHEVQLKAEGVVAQNDLFQVGKEPCPHLGAGEVVEVADIAAGAQGMAVGGIAVEPAVLLRYEEEGIVEQGIWIVHGVEIVHTEVDPGTHAALAASLQGKMCPIQAEFPKRTVQGRKRLGHVRPASRDVELARRLQLCQSAVDPAHAFGIHEGGLLEYGEGHIRDLGIR